MTRTKSILKIVYIIDPNQGRSYGLTKKGDRISVLDKVFVSFMVLIETVITSIHVNANVIQGRGLERNFLTSQMTGVVECRLSVGF